MTKRRLQWAITTPEGKPLLIDGVIAVVDDETGAVSLDQRTQEVVAEVLRNNPVPSRSYLVPGIDLAQEVDQLIQDKHEVGISVRSPLPAKKAARSGAAQAITIASTPYDEMIRAILTAVHSQMQYLRANLTGETQETINFEDMRHGRLGQALYRLARVATGDEHVSSREYFELVDYIQQFLSRDSRNENQTAFAQVTQAAKRQTINMNEWITVSQAARRLGVDQSQIMRLLANSAVEHYVDESTGHVLVYLQDFPDTWEQFGTGD